MKQEEEHLKKPRRFKISPISACFGIIGELSSNALAHRKHSYRTATISLCLSFLLLTSFLTIFTVRDAYREISGRGSLEEGHVYANISDGQMPDPEVLDRLSQIPEAKEAAIYNQMTCATWVSAEDASSDIQEYLGGFDAIVDANKYSLIERDNAYRLRTTLVGLEESCFREYCRRLGVDPDPYLKDPSQALAYNYTKDPDAGTWRNTVRRELLKLEEGQEIKFTERAYDEDEGDHTFSLRIGKLIDTLPCSTLYDTSYFTLTLVMPLRSVLDISASCSVRRQNSARSLTAVYLAGGDENVTDAQIEKLSTQVDEIISSYYGSGDYLVSDIVEQEKMDHCVPDRISRSHRALQRMGRHFRELTPAPPGICHVKIRGAGCKTDVDNAIFRRLDSWVKAAALQYPFPNPVTGNRPKAQRSQISGIPAICARRRGARLYGFGAPCGSRSLCAGGT